MSTLLANRVQSAYPRSIHRSSSNVEHRPITSMDTHTNICDRPAWQILEPSTSSGTISNRQRPKTSRTGSRSSTASTPFSVEKLHAEEISALIRSVDRDDTFIVQVDCLANYRKLVETINLRRTPFDCKLLCTLQQRENRIIQRNACRDTRFLSLMDTLQPKYIIKIDENQSNDVNDIKY